MLLYDRVPVAGSWYYQFMDVSVPIGKSNFRKSRIEINRLRHEFAPRSRVGRKLARAEKALGICRVLNNKVGKYLPDEMSLRENLRFLLWDLESRSFYNRGDTKWSDAAIAKEFGVKVRTIQRYMERLEQLGFLTRFTARRFDKKTKTFYCDRAIRMTRVFVFHSMTPHKAKVIGWKSDPRPEVEPSQYWIDEGWFTSSPYEKWTEDLEIVVVRPKMNSTIEMVKYGLWSWSLAEVIGSLRGMALNGHEKAKRIMGSRLYEVRG